MKKFILFIFTLITQFLLSSCDYEIGIHPFNLYLEYEGITFSNDEYGIPEAVIPASGANFTVIGKGKYKEYTFLKHYEINGKSQKEIDITAYDKPEDESKLIFKADWGGVKQTLEYKIYFTINPNTTNEVRKFVFYVGPTCKPVHIYINQPPMKAE